MSIINGGGCSGLFHMLASNRKLGVLVLSLGIGGVATYIRTDTPGQRMGTEAVLESVQKEMVKKNPWLPIQTESLRAGFDRIDPTPTEEEVRHVLSLLEPCTDEEVKDVLSNPAQRREAAWLYYLDTYSRYGAGRANQLFVQPR